MYGSANCRRPLPAVSSLLIMRVTAQASTAERHFFLIFFFLSSATAIKVGNLYLPSHLFLSVLTSPLRAPNLRPVQVSTEHPSSFSRSKNHRHHSRMPEAAILLSVPSYEDLTTPKSLPYYPSTTTYWHDNRPIQ